MAGAAIPTLDGITCVNADIAAAVLVPAGVPSANWI